MTVVEFGSTISAGPAMASPVERPARSIAGTSRQPSNQARTRPSCGGALVAVARGRSPAAASPGASTSARSVATITPSRSGRNPKRWRNSALKRSSIRGASSSGIPIAVSVPGARNSTICDSRSVPASAPCAISESRSSRHIASSSRASDSRDADASNRSTLCLRCRLRSASPMPQADSTPASG